MVQPVETVGGIPLPYPRRFPVVITGPVVAGAVLWTFSSVFFVVQVIAELAWARPYSLATNYISDLGNTACGPSICSPLHGLVNATFVVVGLCHLLGALLVLSALPRLGLGIVVEVLMILAGAGLGTAGGVPENVDGSRHTFAAYQGLISLNLAMIVLGVCIVAGHRSLGVMAMGAGIVGFVGLALLWWGTAVVPVGAAERLADYPSALMVVVLGAFILVYAARHRRL